MTDNRSERLRRRRKQSTERANRTESSTEDAPDFVDEPAVTEDDSGDSSDGSSVKEEQIGTYMYLPESQTKELRRHYNILKAEYEFKYDEEFEKNRHFYPLVIRHGLDSLEELDAAEIRNRLEEMDVI
ncbi:MAG: hypothetical protein V5A55_03455 [Halovenus sp.]